MLGSEAMACSDFKSMTPSNGEDLLERSAQSFAHHGTLRPLYVTDRNVQLVMLSWT